MGYHKPQGFPSGYTRSSAGTTHDVLLVRTSATNPQRTPGGCSTSSSPKPKLVVPKIEPRNDLNHCSYPYLKLFCDTKKKTKKIPYIELPIDAIINVFNRDTRDIDIMAHLMVESEANKRVNEEVLFVAKLNAKFEQKWRKRW